MRSQDYNLVLGINRPGTISFSQFYWLGVSLGRATESGDYRLTEI